MARAAALKGLSPADRQLVLSRNIRKGMNEDAVYVAWGTPSRTSANYTQHGPQECWTYVTTYYGDGGGYFGVSRSMVHGENGDYYDTHNFYPAPGPAQQSGGTRSTDVPVMRVRFENGRAVDYKTAY